MKQDDYFVNLELRDSQLKAIVKIYDKYFAPKMPEKYNGRGIIALWYPNAQWETGKGDDANHNHIGIISDECRYDELWNEFSDIIPYMFFSATITKMPSGQVMSPHVDRKWRPKAIYFPIHGCTEDCISEYYDLPKASTDNSQGRSSFPPATYSYAIKDKAILTNVHEWHGVKNNSKIERIAFGWNMQFEYSFDQCKNILTDLGYIK